MADTPQLASGGIVPNFTFTTSPGDIFRPAPKAKAPDLTVAAVPLPGLLGAATFDIKAVSEDERGTFEAILSAPTVDRDGEVIDALAFDPLPDHLPIDIDHGMSVRSTVASGEPFYEGDILKFRGSFASTALGQEVRTLVLEGHVRKMSVAFMGAVREVDDRDGRMHIRSAELLNAAIVAIPSNREASILAAKSADLRAERDPQVAHDLALTLGAKCNVEHAAEAMTDATVAFAKARAAMAEAAAAL